MAAVAARPEGAEFLRAFFFNNLVGRFTEVPGVGYASSHPGSPGTYLLQLPVLLLPWTLLVVAAAAAAWRRSSGGDRRSAWRFAVVSIVPGLLVLSAAATARDIYAAVLMPGFALLGGLWAARGGRGPGAPRPGDGEGDVRLPRQPSRSVLPPALLLAALHLGAPAPAAPVAVLLAGWAAGTALAARSWLAARGGRLGPALAGGVACWVVAWSLALRAPMIAKADTIAVAIQNAGICLIVTSDRYHSSQPPRYSHRRTRSRRQRW